MITRASDYEMWDMTGLSGYITGDVLPVRAVAADGSELAMRYEDLLFLQEAFLERYEVISTISGRATPKTRELSPGNFLAPSTIGGPVFVDNTPSPTFNFVQTNATTIADALRTLGWSFTDAQQSISGKALGIDDVRHAFWRSKKFTRTVRTVGLGDCATVTRTTTNVYSDGTVVQIGTDTYAWDGELYSTAMDTIGSSANSRFSFSMKSTTGPRWAPAGGRRWLYLMEATHTHRGSSATVVRRLVTRTGTYSSLGDPTLLTQQFASAVGMPWNSSPYYSANDGYAYRVLEVAQLTDHNFPAEVNSVSGWTWTPSSP